VYPASGSTAGPSAAQRQAAATAQPFQHNASSRKARDNVDKLAQTLTDAAMRKDAKRKALKDAQRKFRAMQTFAVREQAWQHDSNDEFLKGTVTSISPLKVAPHFTAGGATWDEVRKVDIYCATGY